MPPDSRTPSTSPCCLGESGVRARPSVNPSTAFSGVRTSWLVTARKADLARLAASAATRWASASLTMRSSLALRALASASARLRSITRPS
ncbi:hypothetical protein D3C81_1536380 [compost metagenome]